MFNDICINMYCGGTTVLVLLDPSAAFDTVDDDILLNCWKSRSDSLIQYLAGLSLSKKKNRDFLCQ